MLDGNMAYRGVIRKFLLACFTFSVFLNLNSQSPNFQKNNELTIYPNWSNFSSSSNIYGVVLSNNKPLQYNPELNVVSFIQRKSEHYIVSPALQTNAASGAIVAMISSNWGVNWDSSCIWANNINWGRYPQGGIYNPKGNHDVNNAFVVGTGPTTTSSNPPWSGNFFASKQLGNENYTNIASPAVNAQQFVSNSQMNTQLGIFDFSRYSFCCTDDGLVRSLAELGNSSNQPFDPPNTIRGACILKGVFNDGIFNWQSDSIVCPTEFSKVGGKLMYPQTLMAWNKTGNVGYVLFIGTRLGATKSNKCMQPILFKTNNSGHTWELLPALDFNSESANPIKQHLPAVNHSTLSTASIIPWFNFNEGIDIIVDKNDKLHIACFIHGASSSDLDSLNLSYTYGAEKYSWPHSPGKRPYLYDFIGDGNTPWLFGIVDSLPSEAPGFNSSDAGYQYNPWDESFGQGSKTQYNSRLQLSRTPDGEFVLFSWTESDTNLTNQHCKWNILPNIKLKLLNTSNFLLSPTKINLTAGADATIKNRAMMHYISPYCSSATIASNVGIKLPVTISNNPSLKSLISSSHWFAAADLNFEPADIAFTSSLAIVEDLNYTITDDEAFAIFPNPVVDKLTINYGKIKSKKTILTIYSTLGQLVFSTTTASQKQILDLSYLASGIYYVELESDFGKRLFKLIKE